MEFQFSKRAESFQPNIFNILNEKRQALIESGKKIYNMSVGTPDFPPAQHVLDVVSEAAKNPEEYKYSLGDTGELLSAVEGWYQNRYGVTLQDDEILSLAGSQEGFAHVALTLCDPGDVVLVPNPGYPTYRSAATIAGGVCVDYKLREATGWMPDFDEIERQGIQGVKMMIVNYPHMPTGAIPQEGLFQKLVDFAKKHNILLLHDNPYSFLRNPRPASLLAADGAMDVAIELNSLSKSHSMAGWRIGMIGAAKQRIDEIIRFKSNMDSGMFYPMQAAAAKALSLGDDWYRSINKLYGSREAKAYEILNQIGCSYDAGQAGLFVWGRLPEGAGDCYEFSDKILNSCGVFLTPGGIFGSEGNRYVRISLCATEELLQRSIDKIKTLL